MLEDSNLLGKIFPKKFKTFKFIPRIVESIVNNEFHMVKAISDVVVQPMEWESLILH
jgi:hypothetical protein